VRFKPSSTFAILSNSPYLTNKNQDHSFLVDVKHILQAVKTIFCRFPTFMFTLTGDQNDLAFSWS